jgi:hypothetical protein
MDDQRKQDHRLARLAEHAVLGAEQTGYMRGLRAVKDRLTSLENTASQLAFANYNKKPFNDYLQGRADALAEFADFIKLMRDGA